MGSLHRFKEIDESTLRSLFKLQQEHLNYFFENLDFSKTLSFTKTLLNSGGTIFFSGIGKCMPMAKRISRILTSISIRSAFLSPLDALHGDLGAVSSSDVLVLFSKSGSSEELLRLVPFARAKGTYLVSLTSVEGNALAAACDMNVHLPVERELCPFNLAPVTSTVIQLLFGNTVATALMRARDFTMEEYAANHPAGRVGKSLIFKVKDLIMEQLVELTRRACGLLVRDEGHRLIGTFTDGDLRHTPKASRELIFNFTVGEMCNRNPRTISPEAMAVEAMEKMESQSTLRSLFKLQQEYLNYFFENLDFSKTLSFTKILLNSGGTIFFSGVGECIPIAKQISRILTSISILSAFLSPLDALHGNLGAVSSSDVLVLFSKSGSSEELLRLVPFARAKGAYLVSLTSVEGNALAVACDMNVHLPVERELCPFNLAPVTSTVIQLLFGNTVATAVMRTSDFTMEEYAANHPAGRIGKSLIFKVKDVMKEGEDLPVCKEGDLIMEQLVELTRKACGCLLVRDEEHRLIGTFTDGDLRRTLKANRELIFNLTVGEMCNRNPRTISPEAMAVEAMKKMESPPSPVQFLPVINDQNFLIGIVTLHGLVSAGL